MKEKTIWTENTGHTTIFFIDVKMYEQNEDSLTEKKRKVLYFQGGRERYIYGSHSLMVSKCYHSEKFSFHSVCIHIHNRSQNALDFAQLQSERFFFSSFGEFISIIRIFIDIVSREIAQYSI